MDATDTADANCSLVVRHYPKGPIVISKIGFVVNVPKGEHTASECLINMLADGVAGVRASLRDATPLWAAEGSIASKSDLAVPIAAGSYLVFNAYGSCRDVAGEIFYEWRRKYDASGAFEA